MIDDKLHTQLLCVGACEEGGGHRLKEESIVKMQDLKGSESHQSVCWCMCVIPAAGYSEAARAGYEFGLVKSALQVLVAHLDEHDSRCSKVGTHKTSGFQHKHITLLPRLVSLLL